MYVWLLFKCFIVGVSASSTLGPIFVLTFNRSALYGFWRGFVTALGAAFGDSLYFFLALIGVLNFIGTSRRIMIVLDLAAGIILIFLALNTFKKVHKLVHLKIGKRKSLFLMMLKAFVLTIFNPLVLLFFMFIGIQVLPTGIKNIPNGVVILGSFLVGLGSLTVLSVVALAASFFGSCISEQKLRIISLISSFIFAIVGIYFIGQSFFNIFKYYQLFI